MLTIPQESIAKSREIFYRMIRRCLRKCAVHLTDIVTGYLALGRRYSRNAGVNFTPTICSGVTNSVEGSLSVDTVGTGTSEKRTVSIKPKYPLIEIDHVMVDGHALGVVSAVSSALRQAGVSNSEIAEYEREALSGDYQHVLQASLRMVSFR